LDFDYRYKEGITYVYIYGKQENGNRICVIHQYKPFFYAQVHDLDKARIAEKLKDLKLENKSEPAKVIGWEEAEKELLGKKIKLWKIYTNYPKAVPVISRELQSWGIECYEKDILFVHRCLRDMNITPMTLVQAEGEFSKETSLRVPIFNATSVKQSSLESISNPRILALDIETYARDKIVDFEKNPILMIAFYGVDETGEDFRKVLTWKKFKHDKEFIEFVKDEVKLLERFKEIILEFKPDILTGYFSDGFDLPYIKHRAEMHRIRLDLGADYSYLQAGSKADFREGDSKITGILHLDMCKFVRNIFGKNMKTDSYSLDSVSEEILGDKKQIINLDQLAEVWDNSPDGLHDYCEYNLHDAHLTLRLCKKLLYDMLEFTKIVGLPTFDVIRMRFARLVESYILKRAGEYNVLAPNKPQGEEMDNRMEETYEGAFVYEPIPGLYKELVVFDFRSLYPSIITSHNIGPESFHCACCREKAKVPTLDEYWFCTKQKNFIPTVLEQLISIRADLKKQIKTAKAKKEDTKMLEARSISVKLLANSFYGYLGFFGARWYSLESARSTTAYARNYIQKTMNKAEESGFRVCYGDSLTPERKIFVMEENKEVKLISIGKFVDSHFNDPEISRFKTLSYVGDKLVYSSIKKAIRHQYNSKDKGPLLKLITTHGTTEVTSQHSIYKFSTVGGNELTDASSLKVGDHLVSLTHPPVINNYKEGYVFDLAKLNFGTLDKDIWLYTDKLFFPDVKGTCPYCHKEVLSLSSHVFNVHHERRIPKRADASESYSFVGFRNASGGKIPRYWILTTELAWILGYFCAEGSCSDIEIKKRSPKRMISFGSQDLKQIERVKHYFDSVLREDLKVIVDYDKRINKNTYYYRAQKIPLVGLFNAGFGCGKGSRGKRVPDFIYTANEEIKRAFLNGYLTGDGNSKPDKRYKTHFVMFDTNSKDLACGLNYLFKSLEWGRNSWGREIKHVGWKYRRDKPDISSLRVQGIKKPDWEHGGCCVARIKEIVPVDYSGFVYDLEVEGNHNFVDAEGLILVHNTDSCFVLLGEQSLDKALKFQKEINAALPGTMELELEGYYPRGIFVAAKGTEKGAKKKYALISKEGKLKITGFETIRRNCSPLAKDLQLQVLRMVLEDKAGLALAYVKDVIKELQAGKFPLDKLIIKTQITKELNHYSSIAPHVAIAWQMVKKGERIAPGSIIEYIICKGTGLVRDRAKIPTDVAPGDYDADYYLNNQLIPAVSSIFNVLGYKEEELTGKGQTGLGKFF
jgi:DNA polymerase elongation subunit (family B)